MNSIDRFAPSGMINRFAKSVKSSYPSFFDAQFCLHELEELIASSREGSSPGSDLISYSLLKLLPSIAIQKLLFIFNRMLLENSFPDDWREYDVVLINKNDFRPIALSSCVLKLFEKLIKSRLERFIELDMLLPGTQYDFRKGKSYDDCIALLVLEIHKEYINYDPVEVLFLDIKGAYDNINSSILFNIINPSKFLFIIKSLYVF